MTWKIGVEVELVAPRGSSRRALAEHLAAARGGVVRTVFHPQSEPSLAPGVPVFENLTLGFDVFDGAGALVARCVDDLTLQDDLEREHAPAPGWFRVVSDDMRFLSLVKRLGRADGSPLDAVLPVAELFGTKPEVFADGTIRVTDETLAPIVIVMPLPGERERPCEIVSPPFSSDEGHVLEALLEPARALGFTIARESATHVHFDAEPLCSARAIRHLVHMLEAWGPSLKRLVGTNTECRRLGEWPDALRDVVGAPDFSSLPWPEARARLQAVGLTKYCDFNLKNIVHDIPNKHTFEVRVLPGLDRTAPILESAALFEAILRYCLEASDVKAEAPRAWSSRDMRSLLDRLPLDDEMRRRWVERLAAV